MSGLLPDELQERLRTYFAAFLPVAAVEDALDSVASTIAYWGDRDEVAVLAAARAELASRLRVAPDVEALVLHDDVGVPVPEVAEILDLPASRIRQMLDAALVELGEPPSG